MPSTACGNSTITMTALAFKAAGIIGAASQARLSRSVFCQ
jgi:hypothetical protein